ncbi:MAG: autotransporter-associated beta strand repeat-containing protein, partial [Chthoniobacteraceae bacterium]
MRTHGPPILTRSLATTLATLACCGTALATDGIWKRTTGAWDDPVNWLDGQIADGVDAIADFSMRPSVGSPKISLRTDDVRTVGRLIFGVNNWELGSFSNEKVRLDVGTGSAEILVLDGLTSINATISGDDGINVSSGDGPGGRLRLYAANTFSGGLTVSGGIVQLYHSLAAGTNVITISGKTVETRVDIRQSSPPVANAFVIEEGVTPGDGHGVIDASVPVSASNPQQVSGTITINGSTGNGGHLFGGSPSSLILLGAISASVPVVQAGGRIEYHGGGDYSELRVTGTAYGYAGGIPASAAVTLGADETGDGMLSIRENLTLGGLNLGRSGSGNRGVVRGLLTLTGDLTAQGEVTHRIEYGTLDLSDHHSVFTVADGLSDIDLEIASPITGTAGFTKAGAGTLLVSQVVTNTGPLVIESGVFVASTANSGPLTLSSGATLAIGTDTTAGLITAKSITFGAGTTAKLKIGTGGDRLAALQTDGLSVDGTSTLKISTFGGPLAIGTYELIGYTGSIQGAGLSGFTATLPGRTVGTLVDAGSAVALNVTGNDTAVWTSAVNGHWDVENTQNWKLQSNSAATNYLEGDDVRFDDGAPVTSVTLDESASPSRVVFANSTNVPYVLAGTGGIEGTAILSKTGTGTATIRNRNGYTGATTISEGTLAVDHDSGAITSSSVVDIAPGGTLALTSSNSDFTFDRPLSGAGAVVLDANAGGTPGGRTINLTGDNTGFSGDLILSPTPGGGSTRTGPLTPSNFGAASVVVGSGAQVRFGGGEFANSFQITGAGYVEPASRPPHPDTGLGSEGGSGALFGGGQTLSGPILLNGNAQISSSLAGGGLIVAGSISATSPSDQLVVGGGSSSSVVILAGANSYGPTWVNSGSGTLFSEQTLQIGNDGNTGTLGTGLVTLLGQASALATLRFRRLDGYVLENDISAIGNAADAFVDADVRGAGFSSNGRSIDLGPPDLTGGTFRVGKTRSDSLAVLSGVLNAGTISVGPADGITNAALDLEAGSLISVGNFHVGDAAGATGAVTQRDGDVSVAGTMRVGVAYQSSGRYELAGGLLTLTAPVGVSGPIAGNEPGGIRVGSGTGEFLQTGGVLTTNWIRLSPGPVPPVGPTTPTGVNSYTVSGGVLILKSQFGLTSVEGSTAFNLRGGTIKAAPGVSPAFDSETISVTGLVTLEAHGGDVFHLDGPLQGSGELALTGDGTLHLRDTNGSGGSLRGVSVNVGASATVRADRTGLEVWSGALHGSGSLLKENSGSLFLTGTGNGFSGSTVVSAGRLELPADFASSSVIVADGAALGGEATLPSLTMGTVSGSTLFIDGSTTSALTAANLTLRGTTIIDFSAPPETADPITVLNYSAKSGPGNVVLAGDWTSETLTPRKFAG